MSEQKGPFEAAIEELKQSQYIQSGLWMEEHNPTEYDSAIRVLEAAGKVDKGALLTLGANAVCIADYYCQGAELWDLEARFKRGEDDLKIIIASLPDKE